MVIIPHPETPAALCTNHLNRVLYPSQSSEVLICQRGGGQAQNVREQYVMDADHGRRDERE